MGGAMARREPGSEVEQPLERLGDGANEGLTFGGVDGFGLDGFGQGAGEEASLLSLLGLGAPAGQHPTLRWGASGLDVRECQRKLNLHGAALVEDGQFGPATDGAVRAFQRGEGLAADGVVGPLTWGALDAGLGPKAAQPDLPGLGGDEGVAGLGRHPSQPGPSHQTAPPTPTPATRERDLDEAMLMGMLLADTSELQHYVASGVVSREVATVLAGMRDLGGDAQYTYEHVMEGLTDGSLLGVVFVRDRNPLVAAKVPPGDPDRQRFATLQPTPGGAVFDDDASHSRGLVVVDNAPKSTRSLILSIVHEVNHSRNRASQEAVEADTSGDIADGVTTVTAAELAETRRIYVDELVARHAEWWSAWTIRMHRDGNGVGDVDPPAPQPLFVACLEFAIDASFQQVYDPFGYWQALMARGDDSMERQVGGWMRLVAHESFSGNPYRDLQSQAAFLAGSAFRTRGSAQADGLDDNF
ncbi:MAG: peptidoglycan-binding domain-containing protein [Myxococcota bacterium]